MRKGLHPAVVALFAFAIVAGSLLWFAVFLMIVAVGDANYRREQELQKVIDLNREAERHFGGK